MSSNKDLTLFWPQIYWEDLIERVFVSQISDNNSTSLFLLKKRDPQFLTETFTKVNPVLLKVLAAQNIYGESAMDLVQQTWATFFEGLDNFEGRSEIQTYLCGILFNKVREERRKAKKYVFEDDSENVFREHFSAEGWWKRPPQNPDEMASGQELAKFLEECLEGLTEQQRTAFLLREVEEDDSDNIAEVLGVSLANLRVLLFRAKDKLRMCLGGRAGITGSES